MATRAKFSATPIFDIIFFTSYQYYDCVYGMDMTFPIFWHIAISHAFRTSVIMVIYLLYSMISYWVLWHIYLGAVILPQFFYNSTKSRIGQDTGHFRRAATSTGAGFLPYPENISLYFLCPSMLFARANIFYGYKIIIRSGCLPS